MLLTGKERSFCLLEYTLTQLNKTVQHEFVREFAKIAPTAMSIWTLHKKDLRGEVSVQSKGSWTIKLMYAVSKAVCILKTGGNLNE